MKKKEKFVHKRDRITKELINNVKNLYPKDKLFLGQVIELCGYLDYSDLTDKELNAMVGFMSYAAETQLKASIVVTTILHDINGIIYRPACFLPRTTNYIKYYNELVHQ